MKTTRHRLQTTHELGPDHWVVARPSRRGGWDTVEIRGAVSVRHDKGLLRRQAEVIAAAVAATRTHNTVSKGA